MLKSGIKYGKVFALMENEKPYAFGMMVANSERLYSLPYQIAAGAVQLLFGCGVPVILRSLKYEHEVGKIRKSMMPKNHLYGYFLAIDPAKQLDAFRSSNFLLEGGVLWAKEHGLTFYFETMSKRHHIYYAKHGFKTTGEFDFPKLNLTFFSMQAE